MASKTLMTRKTNMLAGTRLPLPGQHHLHETNLRAELINEFKPTGPIEAIWVADWTCNGFVPVTYFTMPPWPRMRAG